ncbi:hypothetical protein ANANG_G00152870 [Anguilla anguilla]|uniref:Uncharacterized protein n=1 Tax=Anguilla anguilla TaxID=7936 RepID=A0A9D3M711_ANGAN|nr:hypothetical protein ANANG_G00152870 [Anguilla anguilla]
MGPGPAPLAARLLSDPPRVFISSTCRRRWAHVPLLCVFASAWIRTTAHVSVCEHVHLAGGLALDDLTFNEQQKTPRLDTDLEGGESATGAARGLWGPSRALPGATFLLILIVTVLGPH